jgi:pimeloyl-ACP methyl ester carboxylesterase
MELSIDSGGVRLAGTVDLPAGPVRGGIVVLHAAEAGHRSYFCYEHLARLLAAALHPDLVAFLVLVSSSGVSPAAQMRYGTAEQLRRHGYGEAEVAELGRLRATVEAYQRGGLDRATAQAEVDRSAARPWFPLVYLPRELPDRPGTWRDMDADPVPVFAQVTCPTLLFYGATDAWVPIDDSVAAWRRATAGAATPPTVRRLDGCDHYPTLGEGEDLDSISPQYAAAMVDWLDAVLPDG